MPEPSNVARGSERTPKRRGRIPVILLVVLGIAVILAVIGAMVWHVLSKDEPPPDVSDLAVVRLDLPDERNAFAYFEKAAAAMDWPELHEYEPPAGTPADSEEWEERLVAEFLKRPNEECLRLWEKGMAVGSCQVPEVTGFDHKMPYLKQWRAMTRLLNARATHDFREGREALAFDREMRIVEFGRMIQDSGGSVIHYLLGKHIKNIGLWRIRHWLSKTTLSPEQLLPLVERLAAYESNRKALADGYRVEYQAVAAMVDDVVAGDYEKLGILGMKQEKRLSRYKFKPNQTKRMYADFIRWLISNGSKPRWEWKADLREDVVLLFDAEDDAVRQSMLKGNVMGKMLVSMAGAALLRVNSEACMESWEVRATRAMIALRCYEARTGELPDNLQALVPDYMEEVPLDPFDGKPLNYSKEEGLISAASEEYRRRNGSFEISFGPDGEERETP